MTEEYNYNQRLKVRVVEIDSKVCEAVRILVDGKLLCEIGVHKDAIVLPGAFRLERSEAKSSQFWAWPPKGWGQED